MALLFLSPGYGLSSEGESSFSADNMIANSLKMLGKGYVYQADLAKAKAEKIRQLRAMTPDHFKNHYGEIYSYVGQAEERFGFSKDLTRKGLIAKIEALDKKTIYAMIDSVSNENIAKRVQQEWERILGEAPEGNYKEKIDFIWGGIARRIASLKGPA